MVSYVHREAWQADFQSFAFGFYTSDAMDFYSFIEIASILAIRPWQSDCRHSLMREYIASSNKGMFTISWTLRLPRLSWSHARKRGMHSLCDVPKQPTTCSNDTLPRSWHVTISIKPLGGWTCYNAKENSHEYWTMARTTETAKVKTLSANQDTSIRRLENTSMSTLRKFDNGKELKSRNGNFCDL